MAIPLIKVRGRITSADALTLDQIDYDVLIGEHANVTDWFTPKASKVTLVGSTISSISSRKSGSAATLAFHNVVGYQKPAYSAADTNFNGRPSVTHDSGASGDQLDYSGSFPYAADFFKVVIAYKASLPGTNQHLLSSATTGNRHNFIIGSDGYYAMRVGASASEAKANSAFVAGLVCAIGCWSLADTRARISLDLGATWGGDIDAAAVTDTDVASVGIGSDFAWTDVLFGNIDLSKDNATAVDLLTLIASYARGIVGVEV